MAFRSIHRRDNLTNFGWIETFAQNWRRGRLALQDTPKTSQKRPFLEQKIPGIGDHFLLMFCHLSFGVRYFTRAQHFLTGSSHDFDLA